MHRLSWMWVRYGVMAVVLGAALAAPAETAPPDAWVTTKIKLALLTTEGVSGTAIRVDTVAVPRVRRVAGAIQRPDATRNIRVSGRSSRF